MPLKRPRDQTRDTMTSTQAKRLKLQEARTIAVQPATVSGNVAGPSNAGPVKRVQINSMKGLPTALDVEKFTESRSFEIQSMQKAMKAASSSTTHRAWQELPRHLRRRAASHDVRRVPVRLRDRSRKEMDSMKRKALGRSRPKRGKMNQVPKDITFLKRQINKKWLESHLWHAKRMKMENMWGYRLAVQPTEKSFRPSHRASVHGSILHDASYDTLIELVSEEPVLEHILLACCDPQGSHPSSPRFKGGVRMCETAIYKLGEYPHGLIGHVSLIWRPLSGPKPQPPPRLQNNSVPKRRRRKKVKQPAPTIPEQAPKRMIWIRCHPLLREEVTKTLKLAASRALEALKARPEHANKEYTAEVADLLDSFNIFEIMGAKSSQVIHGALSPAFGKMGSEFKDFWNQFGNVQSSGSVPGNMVVNFLVHDPRLNFSPKNSKVYVDEEQLPTMPQAWTCLPSQTLADGEFWDIDARIKPPIYPKKSIDQRRAQNVVPGTSLVPKPSDNLVPLMLVQRTLGSPSPSHHSSASDPSLHGWTLFLPKYWSVAFLTSLVYTGTRVGGQRERAHQSFEAGVPHFPRDFPTCSAYDVFVAERAAADKLRWERKPPAKRPSWDALGTRSPWEPDWEVILSGKSKRTGQNGEQSSGDLSVGYDFVSTQREKTEPEIVPWLLRGPDVKKVVETAAGMLNPAAALWDYVNQLRLKRGMGGLSAGGDAVDGLLRSALVRVKLTLVGRGSPEDGAVIYDVPDQEIVKWKRAEAERKRLGVENDEEDGQQQQDSNLQMPEKDKVIGYVTSGNYSLSRGEAYALGAMPVAVILQMKDRASRLRLEKPLIRVRNRDGVLSRYAYVDIVEG